MTSLQTAYALVCLELDESTSSTSGKNPVAMKSLYKKWHLKYFFFVFAPGLHEKYNTRRKQCFHFIIAALVFREMELSSSLPGSPLPAAFPQLLFLMADLQGFIKESKIFTLLEKNYCSLQPAFFGEGIKFN